MKNEQPDPKDVKFIRWREVHEILDGAVSRQTVRRLMAAGHFPSTILLPGCDRDVWIESEVREWKRARAGTLRKYGEGAPTSSRSRTAIRK